MKKLLLLTTILFFSAAVMFAQNKIIRSHEKDVSVKLDFVKSYKSYLDLTSAGPIKTNGSRVTKSKALGSSGNAFTILSHESNMIMYDPDINTMVFIHRNNEFTYGGTVSEYRYDISTDGGTTWTLDEGILNPSADQASLRGRFPQVSIHNPTGNTNPDNAYLVYSGTYHDNVIWRGYFTGVSKLDIPGTGRTETINDLTSLPIGGNSSVAASLVRGKPGAFWAVDKHTRMKLSGSTKDSTSGIIVHKGVFNSGTSDMDWTFDTIAVDFNYSLDSGAHVSTPLIAFDPTGKYGWIGFSGDVNGNPDPNGVYVPNFYQSTDSGATWTGPIILNLRNFPHCTQLYPDTIYFADDTGVITRLSSPLVIWAGNDLIVDKNGDPHFIAVMAHSAWEGGGPYYAYTGFGLNIFDFTYSNSSGTWAGYYMDSLDTFEGVFFAEGRTERNRPQLSSTPDGSKIFFTWLDSDPAVDPANSNPDLKILMLDVDTDSVTETFNLTRGTDFDAAAYYDAVSPLSIVEGTDRYIIPSVVTEMGPSDGSETYFHYLEAKIGNPSADFDTSYLGYAQYRFRDSSSYIPTTWAWTFGDGAISSSQNPIHEYTENNSYNVCLTATNWFGSDKVCKDIVITTVGMDDLDLENSVSIHPNPTNGNLQIEINLKDIEKANLKVYSILGETIIDKDYSLHNGNMINLDISDNANGIYILKMVIRGSVLTKKITLSNK